jgi:hypothetical protein
MLTIGKLGAGQEAYYLEKVADGAEDYYSGEGEAPGRWMGADAEELGLGVNVASDELRAMLTGRDPASGEPLVAVSPTSGSAADCGSFARIWRGGSPTTATRTEAARTSPEGPLDGRASTGIPETGAGMEPASP